MTVSPESRWRPCCASSVAHVLSVRGLPASLHHNLQRAPRRAPFRQTLREHAAARTSYRCDRSGSRRRRRNRVCAPGRSDGVGSARPAAAGKRPGTRRGRGRPSRLVCRGSGGRERRPQAGRGRRGALRRQQRSGIIGIGSRPVRAVRRGRRPRRRRSRCPRLPHRRCCRGRLRIRLDCRRRRQR